MFGITHEFLTKIAPLNNELGKALERHSKAKKVKVDYIGDNGKFHRIKHDDRDGYFLVYVERSSFAEAMLDRPF